MMERMAADPADVDIIGDSLVMNIAVGKVQLSSPKWFLRIVNYLLLQSIQISFVNPSVFFIHFFKAHEPFAKTPLRVYIPSRNGSTVACMAA